MKKIKNIQINTLYKIVKFWANKTPNAEAFDVIGKRAITYNNLYKEIKDTIARLSALGIKKNNRIAVVLPNNPEMAIIFLAVSSFATCIPLNPDFTKKELNFFLKKLKPHAILLPDNLDNPRVFLSAQKIKIIVAKIKFYKSFKIGIKEFKCDKKNITSKKIFVKLSKTSDIALIIHTSGTTADSKIVPLTHKNICTSARVKCDVLKITQKDQALNMMQLFNVHGISIMITSLMSGGKTIFVPAFNKEKFLGWLKRYKITWFSTTPTIIGEISNITDSKQENNKLRFIRSSAAILPPKIQSKIKFLFGVDIIDSYGMTEALEVACSYLKKKIGSVGKATASEIAIVDKNNKFIKSDKIGEILIKGENVFHGYYKQANKNYFYKGWFRSGDLGYMDNDGFIFIVGRTKEIVNRGGNKIIPAEVDKVLMKHPFVKTAVSFSVPHSSLGEDLAVAIKLNKKLTKKEVYDFMVNKLATYKIPRQILIVDKIPKSKTGKYQRHKLYNHFKSYLKMENGKPFNEIEETLVELWKEVLKMESISIFDNFFQLGGSSILVTQLQSKLDKIFPGKIKVADLFTYPTISELAEYIGLKDRKKYKEIKIMNQYSQDKSQIQCNDIAIIGMSAKTSLSENIYEFWENIRAGRDCIREIPEKRKKDIENYLKYKEKKADYLHTSYLEEIDKFDYEYFGFSPIDARLMNPKHRLFLECAVKTIEDAGQGGVIKGSKTGVYIGFAPRKNTYMELVSAEDKSLLSRAFPHNIPAFIPSRISYFFNLKGPSILIDTACSSSLVGIHLACEAIRNNTCDQAIVGSVRFEVLPLVNMYPDLGMNSKGNKVRSFDEDSDGTVWGEGVATVFLKPLNKAIKDRDNIYAVIKGSAINQDGKSSDLTAPSAKAQSEVISEAWQKAQIDPTAISYIEAHGTGTKLGDPIEVDGINKAFGMYTNKKQFCAIGSVKSNIGHTAEAAGIFGLVKAALALRNKEIPPTIHFKEPNHAIDWENSSVYVVDKLTKWKTDKSVPRRCGVNSFGLSGTNCHVVLEEFLSKNNNQFSSKKINRNYSNGVDDVCKVFTLSAKNKYSLMELVERYKRFLKSYVNKVNFSDLCYTLNLGKEHFNYRLAIIAKDIDDVVDKLEKIEHVDFDKSQSLSIKERIYYQKHKIVDCAQKQADDYEISLSEIKKINLQANLKIKKYFEQKGSKRFKILIQIVKLYVRGADIGWCNLYLGGTIKKISLPTYPFQHHRCWIEINKVDSSEKKEPRKKLNFPLIDNSLIKTSDQEIFSTFYCVDKHWVLNEHKVMGEYMLPGTAYIEMAMEACKKYFNKNNFEIKDVVYLKSLVVKGGEKKEVRTIIKKNSDYFLFFIEGIINSNEKWERLAEGKIFNLTSKKFPEYKIGTLKKEMQKGKLLNLKKEKSLVYEYGRRWNNIEKVYISKDKSLSFFKLQEGLENEFKDYVLYPALLDNVFGAILIKKMFNINPQNSFQYKYYYPPFLIKSIKIIKKIPTEFYSYMRKEKKESGNNEIYTLNALLIDTKGQVFSEISGYSVRKFKKQSIVSSSFSPADNFCYNTIWHKVTLPQNEQTTIKNAVVLLLRLPGDAISDKIISAFKSENKIIEVMVGNGYKKISNNKYLIRNNQRDFNRLLRDVKNKNVSYILHTLTSGGVEEIKSVKELEQSLGRGVLSLFYLTKAILDNKINNNIDLVLISSLTDEVSGQEKYLCPQNAALFGLGKVVLAENPNLRCRTIDIDYKTSTDNLVKEISSRHDFYKIAYRNNLRYAEVLDKVNIRNFKKSNLKIKKGGVYIITGGTGGLGLEIAKYLAGQNKVRIFLMNRTKLPVRRDWENAIKVNIDHKLSYKLKTIKDIEKIGSEVFCYSVDVANSTQLKKVINKIRSEYNQINGIIHAAGVAGDGFIINKAEKIFKKVMRPKIQGAWLLDEFTKQDNLDFFINFSSVATIFSWPGQGDYTAANSYLDIFSKQRAKKRKQKTLSINWAGWQEIGMAVDYQANTEYFIKKLLTKTALDIFHDIIKRDINNIMIGEFNYNYPLLSLEYYRTFNLSLEIKKVISEGKKLVHKNNNTISKALSSQTKLTGRNNNKYSEIEKYLVQIWGKTLGYQEINIRDNFFELGGDSLNGMEVINRINVKLNLKITIKDIFEYTTINNLSARVEDLLIADELDL
ncbi:MAG: SDR family NAD(P)-dependent oxidoreductase [Promethearchaeota archaeon]